MLVENRPRTRDRGRFFDAGRMQLRESAPPDGADHPHGPPAVLLPRSPAWVSAGLACEPWLELKRPLRLAIVDDYAVVVAGVASFLRAERIDVVETGASEPVISDVDIVLYDTFGQVQGTGIDLEDFVRNSGGAKVVIYSWNLNRDLIDEALVGGASGYLSKVLTGPAIVEALERIMERRNR